MSRDKRLISDVSPLLKYGYALPVAAAVLVALPSLGFGFFIDDYMHLLTVEGKRPEMRPWDVYRFTPGNAPELQPLLDSGPLPWYTLPNLKLRFCRPLSCATMALDFALFGHHAAGYHLHSLLWYLALTASGMLLLRRSLPGALGVLTLLLFAVDEGHVLPVHWWSNRHAMVAATPALLGLVAHLRWREEGWKPGLPLSLLGYALGLLSGETALSVMAYLAAYELFAGPGSFRRRAACVLPGSLLAALYLAAYKVLGFGVYGSGIYIDPIAEPVAYLRGAPARFLALAAAQVFSLPSEAATFVKGAYYPLALAGILSMVVIAVILRRLRPALSLEERRGLRWLLPGAMIATLPALATFPSGRLLLVPSLGAGAAVAVIIRHAWRQRRGLTAYSRVAGALGMVFVVIHLLLTPFAFVLSPFVVRHMDGVMREIAFKAEVDESRISEQEVLVINAADPATGLYPVILRRCLDYPAPKAWRALTMAPHEFRITRTRRNRLEIEVIDGELLVSEPEQLLRSVAFPVRPGDCVAMAGLTVTVLVCGEQGPTRLALDFPAPLEDPQYCFLVWRGRALRRFTIPAEGNSMVLPREPGFLNGAFWSAHLRVRK